MRHAFPFLMREALINLRRHGLMTIAAITTIGVALTLMGASPSRWALPSGSSRHAGARSGSSAAEISAAEGSAFCAAARFQSCVRISTRGLNAPPLRCSQASHALSTA